MEIRGEPGDPFVFPAKCGLPACLSAALYPFFFFFFICPSVTTFLEQGNWYVVFFYFLFTRCNDHLFARDEDYRLSIIFDKIRWYSDLEGLRGKKEDRLDYCCEK